MCGFWVQRLSTRQSGNVPTWKRDIWPVVPQSWRSSEFLNFWEIFFYQDCIALALKLWRYITRIPNFVCFHLRAIFSYGNLIKLEMMLHWIGETCLNNAQKIRWQDVWWRQSSIRVYCSKQTLTKSSAYNCKFIPSWKKRQQEALIIEELTWFEESFESLIILSTASASLYASSD